MMAAARADAHAGVVTLPAAARGRRLDQVLAELVPGQSRAALQRLLREGRVLVDGRAVRPASRVRGGESVQIDLPPPRPSEVAPEAIPLAVLHEDADLIVIDKPAGMVVHPAAGHATGTLVNALLHHCTDLAGIGGVLRPGIVHRLDKDTTGVMVATKTDRAHAALTAAFAAKSAGIAASEGNAIERSYLAITSPAPPAASGTLRTLYGRHPVHRKKFSSKVASGKPAVTHWQVERALHDAALVRFTLETGRTHQIRVHAADHGWALVGDPVYGHKPRDARLAEVARALGRQALHAHVLAFDHPATGARMSFEAPVPADFAAALAALS